MSNRPKLAPEMLRKCMGQIVAALEARGRQYYFFGGVSCCFLAHCPRGTVDIDICIESSSNDVPDPHNWLAEEPFFWSRLHKKFVWVTTITDDNNEDYIRYCGRCFIDIDVNFAGWGSFPKFEMIHNRLTQMPGNCGLSLPLSELLKLKLASWAEITRREGPKRGNDIKDVQSLRTCMELENKQLEHASLAPNVKYGLKEWVDEFNDKSEWWKIGLSF
jgi:hypothetical protein